MYLHVMWRRCVANKKKYFNNYHSELFDGNEHSLDSRMALVIMS